MIFKRKIYNKLKEWKDSSKGSTALLIEGARRIGKSTIVEEFAKNEYKSYILIDFNDVSRVVLDAFNNSLNDLDNFFMILSLEYNKQLFPRESLIIFDEIQNFSKARQTIKLLVKDGKYDYIETGSLISIKENVEHITIPSEEESISMYPLDFEEFLRAFNEKMLADHIRKCFENKVPLDEKIHHKAMILFKQYMLIGGMPKVIDVYLTNNRSFVLADKEKRKILNLYSNDINKADVKYRMKVKSVYDQIPGFLSKHEKRVRISNLDGENKYPAYEETFFWLKESKMTNECTQISDPNVGLVLYEDRRVIKCYMGDTGLLISMTFTEKDLSDGVLYKEILHDNLSINEGMFFENAVAQMLVANGYKLFFYVHYSEAKHRNDIEIDFILSNGSKLKPKIFPIEVKSSRNYKTISLDNFNEKYKSRIGDSYVIHPKNLKVSEGVIYLPIYMTFCL